MAAHGEDCSKRPCGLCKARETLYQALVDVLPDQGVDGVDLETRQAIADWALTMSGQDAREALRSLGAALIVVAADVFRNGDPRDDDYVEFTRGIFVAHDDGSYSCESCTPKSINLGDPKVETWECGGSGWQADIYCRGCGGLLAAVE